jgi:hypothetical protein
MVGASLSHWFALRRLRRSELLALSQWPLSIALALFLAIISLIGFWELIVE